MSTSINVHAGKNQTVKIKPGFRDGTHWVTILIEGAERHETTFYINDADASRYQRAADAFNAALAEPAALTLAAE